MKRRMTDGLAPIARTVLLKEVLFHINCLQETFVSSQKPSRLSLLQQPELSSCNATSMFVLGVPVYRRFTDQALPCRAPTRSKSRLTSTWTIVVSYWKIGWRPIIYVHCLPPCAKVLFRHWRQETTPCFQALTTQEWTQRRKGRKREPPTCHFQTKRRKE